MTKAGPLSADRFDDAHYPAYSMGTASELAGVTPGFLRDLGEAGLFAPHRSEGGHRRYSRHQLELATRARTLVDQGMTISIACRMLHMENQLGAAHRRIAQLERASDAEPDQQQAR